MISKYLSPEPVEGRFTGQRKPTIDLRQAQGYGLKIGYR